MCIWSKYLWVISIQVILVFRVILVKNWILREIGYLGDIVKTVFEGMLLSNRLDKEGDWE